MRNNSKSGMKSQYLKYQQNQLIRAFSMMTTAPCYGDTAYFWQKLEIAEICFDFSIDMIVERVGLALTFGKLR